MLGDKSVGRVTQVADGRLQVTVGSKAVWRPLRDVTVQRGERRRGGADRSAPRRRRRRRNSNRSSDASTKSPASPPPPSSPRLRRAPNSCTVRRTRRGGSDSRPRESAAPSVLSSGARVGDAALPAALRAAAGGPERVRPICTVTLAVRVRIFPCVINCLRVSDGRAVAGTGAIRGETRGGVPFRSSASAANSGARIPPPPPPMRGRPASTSSPPVVVQPAERPSAARRLDALHVGRRRAVEAAPRIERRRVPGHPAASVGPTTEGPRSTSSAPPGHSRARVAPRRQQRVDAERGREEQRGRLPVGKRRRGDGEGDGTREREQLAGAVIVGRGRWACDDRSLSTAAHC